MRIGIIGGAGYTAGELIRILLNHPYAEIVFIHSTSNAGNLISDVHSGLLGETDLRFSDRYALDAVDVIFMCSGHGHSRQYWIDNPRPDSLKIIDLAQDFRDESDGYVYGLPEQNFNRISNASRIANPGCFATAIQLALLPLAFTGNLTDEIHITGITGSTGAGVKPSPTTHFCWRSDNISIYKAFKHQHLTEINHTLQSIQPSFTGKINFIPVRGDFARGIFVMAYLNSSLTIDEANKIYNDYYTNAPFTFVSERNIDLKQVINTNNALVHLEKHDDKLLITAAIDNLLKGASGQAVQNMNIMFGLDQCTGLRLKASAF